MTLIFTDETDESFTGVIQFSDVIYQLLLKISAVPPTVVQIQANTNLAIADGARLQIGSTLFYDLAHAELTYPVGCPAKTRRMFHVVIRALRSQKVDLQKTGARRYGEGFAAYPQKWQLKRPDSNIDHRRVPNLETWFTRHDKTRPPARTPVTIKRAILSPAIR
ncbi:DUF1287 domain-containing protein [Shigella sonnei]